MLVYILIQSCTQLTPSQRLECTVDSQTSQWESNPPRQNLHRGSADGVSYSAKAVEITSSIMSSSRPLAARSSRACAAASSRVAYSTLFQT